MKIKDFLFIGIMSLIIGIMGFIFVTDGKLIIASPTTHQHQHQHQEQFQGQLMINMMLQKGNKVVWKIKVFQYEDQNKIIDFLMTLHPTSSYFAKIYVFNNIKVIYPDFLQEKNLEHNK